MRKVYRKPIIRYTVELLRPCYPYNGPDLVRIHRGTFDEVRDSLSPDAVTFDHCYVYRRSEAVTYARQWAKTHNARCESR